MSLAEGDRDDVADRGGEEPSPAWPWIEVYAVALIALTAVLTAWSAFESSKWGGVMAIRFNEAGAARTESVRASDTANQQVAVDVSLFSDYVHAVAVDDTVLADFYLERFPERLSVAVEAWLATEPLSSADAPETPFQMSEYEVEARQEAQQMEARADRRSAQARQANQRSDNYTITSVFFATVILLAALAGKVASARLRAALLVSATVLFAGTAVIVATFPVEI